MKRYVSCGMKGVLAFALSIAAITRPQESLAIENVLINDVRSFFAPIDEYLVRQLFVVAPESSYEVTNALKGVTFYIYAPQFESNGVSCIQWNTETPLRHLKEVKASDDNGILEVGVKASRPAERMLLGTSEDASATDPIVHHSFYFYVPRLEYCIDEARTNVVSDSSMSKTRLKVGDTLSVYVRAVVQLEDPEWPKWYNTNETSKITRTFLIHPEGDSKKLKFLDMDGKSLSKNTAGDYQLEFTDGLASFKITSEQPVTDGSTFHIDGYPDPADSSGKTFQLHSGFPGGVRFEPVPIISNVVARQRWPWNGLVDVDYEISGETGSMKAVIEFEEQGGQGQKWEAKTFLPGAEPSAAPGHHRATWNAVADGKTNIVARVKATVRLVSEL